MSKIRGLFDTFNMIHLNSSSEEKWRELWKCFKLGVIIELILAFLITLLVLYCNIDFSITSKKVFFIGLHKNDLLYNIFLLVAGPLFEELAFRLNIDLRRKHIVVSTLVILLFYLHKPFVIELYFLGYLLLLLIILNLKKLSPQQKELLLIVNIIFNSLFFATAHITELSQIHLGNFSVFFLSFLMNLIVGLLLCRIRINNQGLQWSILLHLVFNLLPFTLSFLKSI